MFKRFITQKIADGLSKNTIDSYCFALKDYYQWLQRNNINNVTPDDVRDYFVYLRGKKYSIATLRDKFAVINAFYNYCVKFGYLTENPVKIKKPKLPKQQARVFTENEIYTILKYFNNIDTFIKLRDYTIISILLGTGIRRSELLDITDVNGDYIVVYGKGNKQRLVPISDALKTILKRYIIERDKIAICPYLIINRDGGRLTKNGLRAIFTRLSKNTGIGGKRFSSHTWRHTFATQMLQAGCDIVTLQQILGHSDISTTAIYLHWNNTTNYEINNKINPLNKFNKLKNF